MTPESVVKDEFFEVEKLLGVRASLEGEEPVVEYRVKWKDGRADTWCALLRFHACVFVCATRPPSPLSLSLSFAHQTNQTNQTTQNKKNQT